MGDYFYDEDGNLLGSSEEVISKLQQENQALKKQIEIMKEIIEALEHDIKFWKDKSRGLALPTRERIVEVLKRWNVISNATESVLQDYWDCEDDITNNDKLNKIASEILGDDKNA